MTMRRKLLFQGGVLFLAATLGRCSGGTTTPADGGADLATSADLAVPSTLTLTGISPRGAVNTGGATLTLTGTNFQQGATVTIGGQAATNVTVVSGTQLTCKVPAKAATCGSAAVVVTNPDGKTASNASLFMYQSSTLAFAAPTALTMAATTRYVIAADVDNDQDLDLISANSGAGAGNLAIRLNNGTGTFANATTVALGGNSPYAVAAADLNGDNNLDLITARNATADIIVRMGVGNGTFTVPTVDTFKTGLGPTDLALADGNGNYGPPYLAGSVASCRQKERGFRGGSAELHESGRLSAV